MRAWLKRVLIGGYCHGIIPKVVVSAGFNVFRLRYV